MTVVQLTRRLFSVDEYYRMAEAGIFNEDDRVELIEGEIVEMVPIGSHHASVVNRLNAFFSAKVAATSIVSVQQPMALTSRSSPQPDLMLLVPREDFYSESHPGPRDVQLLIEVADTTVVRDRTVKLPLYAGAGIPEYWIVNLEDEEVEVYRGPSGSEYKEQHVAKRGEVVAPRAFPELNITVDEVFG